MSINLNKFINHLIVRTIKIPFLISNLMQNNEKKLKHEKKLLEKEVKN